MTDGGLLPASFAVVCVDVEGSFCFCFLGLRVLGAALDFLAGAAAESAGLADSAEKEDWLSNEEGSMRVEGFASKEGGGMSKVNWPEAKKSNSCCTCSAERTGTGVSSGNWRRSNKSVEWLLLLYSL